MTEVQIPFKTKPGYVMIAIGLFGSAFFGYWFFLLNTSKGGTSNADQATTSLIFIVFEYAFFLFSSGSLLMALCFRIFIVTKDELIIKRPMLFFSRTVYFTDIERIKEQDAPIRVSNNSLTPETIYNGQRTTLELKNGKKIRISSVETGSYKSFLHQLTIQVGKVKTAHK